MRRRDVSDRVNGTQPSVPEQPGWRAGTAVFLALLLMLSTGSDLAGDNGYQLRSWCNPYSKSKVIGQIYFPTDGVALSPDDKQAIGQLVKVFNAHDDDLWIDPYVLLFMGTADARKTTYPGGNKALSEDRASAVWDYFLQGLTPDGRKSVVTDSKGAGARGGTKARKALGSLQYGLAQHRMVAIFRPPVPDDASEGRKKDQDPIPPPEKRRPAESREKALERCRTILRKYPGWFEGYELRQLQQICKETATQDGFLNGMDPEVMTAAFVGGPDFKSEAELLAFVNRSKVRDELMHYSAASPDALDIEVAGAMKGLYSRMNGGIAALVAGTGKSIVNACGNMRRVRLSRYALEAKRNSVYFGWPGDASGVDKCPRDY